MSNMLSQDSVERIEKLAQYVAQSNGAMEATVRERQRTNPNFAFLFGGDGASYYQECLRKFTQAARPSTGGSGGFGSGGGGFGSGSGGFGSGNGGFGSGSGGFGSGSGGSGSGSGSFGSAHVGSGASNRFNGGAAALGGNFGSRGTHRHNLMP
jgi:hypothetical protein